MFTEEQLNQLRELFSPLAKRLEDLDKSVQRLESMEKVLHNLEKSVQYSQTRLDNLQDAVLEVDRTLEIATSSIKDVKDELQQHRRESLNDHKDLVQIVVDSIDSLHADVQAFDRRLAEVERQLTH
ncbi:hypothetical protein ACFWWM_42500 [Streptomyces sp. NPDC058682]|uniref:hypothetical protein n=1 Tax=Streptomyces sp. NPDC058682 TaxID=3346596 RepID=UPI003652F4CC